MPAVPAGSRATSPRVRESRPLGVSQEDMLWEVSQTLQTVTQKFDYLAGEVEQIRAIKGPDPEQAAQSEDRLSKLEVAVSKVKSWKTLLGFLAFLVVGGLGVWTTLSGYARQQIIETVQEAHMENVEPSVKTITRMEKNIQHASVAADYLFRQKELDVQIQNVETELDIHRQQHQELLQEWSALKAARRAAGSKPTKSDRHIELEAQLKILHQEQVELKPRTPEEVVPKPEEVTK